MVWWLGQCECLLDRMYWSSGAVVGSVRVLVGPDVLVQWRARLERTVLGARYHVAVVNGRRSSTEPTGLRSSSTSTARRRVSAAILVCVSSSSTGRRAAGRGGRGQTTLVLRQQLGHCTVALLRGDVSRRRTVLPHNDSIHSTMTSSHTRQ